MNPYTISLIDFCEIQNPNYLADVTDESYFDFSAELFINEINYN